MNSTRSHRPTSEAGGALVEFSLSVLFMVWLCFIICDLLHFSYRFVTAQHLVNEMVRRVTIDGSLNTVGAIQTAIINKARQYGITLNANGNQNITVCNLLDSSCSTTDIDPVGVGRDLIRISINFPYRFISCGWSYNIQVDAMGRNEPF